MIVAATLARRCINIWQPDLGGGGRGAPYLGVGWGGAEFPVRLTVYTPQSISISWAFRLWRYHTCELRRHPYELLYVASLMSYVATLISYVATLMTYVAVIVIVVVLMFVSPWKLVYFSYVPSFMCGANMGICFLSLVCKPAVILCGGKREKIAYICSTKIACCVLKNKSS